MKTCMMLIAALAAASLAGAEPSVRIDGRPRWAALRAKAVALAKANMETVEGWRPQMTCMPGVGKIWQWDSCFMALFAGLAPSDCDGLGNLDNLYAMQSADGYMSMAYVYATKRPAFGERVNPPLFAWAEWLYARRTGDLSRLPRAYDASARLFAWLKANRTRPCNGLYWFEDTGSSGMDNSPRSGYGAKHLDGSDVCWVDLSCQQVLTARCLAKMAPLVGRAAEATKWTAEADELAARINRLMWSERTGFYHDVYSETNNKLAVKTAAAFWTLVSGVATPERAARLAAHLRDPKTFASRYPVPSLSRDDPNYRADGGYWCGGVWPPVVYMVVRGLRENGFGDLAREIAGRHLDQMADVMESAEGNTIWECYCPERAAPARTADGELVRRDFVGWGGLGPLVMLVEDVLGLDVDSLGGRITWRVSERGRQGVRGLPCKGGTLSVEGVLGEDGRLSAEIEVPAPYRLEVILPDGSRRERDLKAGSVKLEMESRVCGKVSN